MPSIFLQTFVTHSSVHLRNYFSVDVRKKKKKKKKDKEEKYEAMIKNHQNQDTTQGGAKKNHTRLNTLGLKKDENARLK